MWLLERLNLASAACVIFLGDGEAPRQVSGGPRGGRTPPYTAGPHAQSLRGKKTQATAKLQIYWSGNKYKYLIKKLLWKALHTTLVPSRFSHSCPGP